MQFDLRHTVTLVEDTIGNAHTVSAVILHQPVRFTKYNAVKVQIDWSSDHYLNPHK